MAGNNQIPEQIIKTSDQSKQATDESMVADKEQTSEETINEKDKTEKWRSGRRHLDGIPHQNI